MAYVPAINAAGLFRLKAPFDALLVPNVQYVCDGVRTIQDISRKGEDPFDLVYLPVALSQEDFNTDLAQGAVIVTLRSNDSTFINVPSTYILGMPDSTGIPYLGYYLAMDIGMLPSSLNMEYLKERLVGVVRETIGVVTNVEAMVTTSPMRLTLDQHKAIDAKRAFNTTESESDYAKFVRVSKELEAMRNKMALMEKWINDHK